MTYNFTNVFFYYNLVVQAQHKRFVTASQQNPKRKAVFGYYNRGRMESGVRWMQAIRVMRKAPTIKHGKK
jgi:hypothetical protein